MGSRGFRSAGKQHSFKEGTLLSFYGELRNANLGSFFVHDIWKLNGYVSMVSTFRRVWINLINLSGEYGPAPILKRFFFFLFPFAPENLVYLARRVRPSSRVSPLVLHTWAESGFHLRDSSCFPRRYAFIHLYLQPPSGQVPSLSGHAITYRWYSLPRVRRHKASKPQGSSERMRPWQVTMDNFFCAPLFFPHPLLLVCSGHV